MELIHLSLQHINEHFNLTYIASADTLTYLDIMMYVEISQVLMLFHFFKNSSRSATYKKLIASNPDQEEQDELQSYKNLSSWYNKTMKASEAFQSIKKFDTLCRE